MRRKILIMALVFGAAVGFAATGLAQSKAFDRNKPATPSDSAAPFIKAINADGSSGVLPYFYPEEELIRPYAFSDSAPTKTGFLFVDIGYANHNMIPAEDSKLAWGDYDNDGDLDILQTGFTLAWGGRVTRIYVNNGDGTFTEDENTGLPDVCYGGVAWGDYDNDGDLDIFLTGVLNYIAWAPRISKIFRNEPRQGGGRIFAEETSAVFPGMASSAVAWGDYDNDGNLDVLLSGQTEGDYLFSKVFHNNGNGSFTDINAGLTGIICKSAAWGDYDNDGDLDILLSGYETSGYVFRIYQNNGDGTFRPHSDICSAKGKGVWGDYDDDGDLDILFTGEESGGRGVSFTSIYRNDGGIFTDINAGFKDLRNACSALGDYDNNGYPDVLLTGWDDEYGASFRGLYSNNGDGTFTLLDPNIPGINRGNLSWGDYDNDGYLDILLAGETMLTFNSTVVGIYRNNGANIDPPLPSNTAPGAPVSLEAKQGIGFVTLLWTDGFDAETPPSGLSYNIFIGTRPTSANILSPMADFRGDGQRMIVGIGSQNENMKWVIKGLPPDTYYWGVQAIDTGFKGSPFVKGSFVVKPDILPPDPEPAPTP